MTKQEPIYDRIEHLFDKEGRVLYLELLKLLDSIDAEDKESFVADVIKRDSSNYSGKQIEALVVEILDVYQGNRPAPKYCSAPRVYIQR